jgi:hypothetical protein
MPVATFLSQYDYPEKPLYRFARRGKPSREKRYGYHQALPAVNHFGWSCSPGKDVKHAQNEVSEWLREIGMLEELKPQTNFKSSTSAEDLLQQTTSSNLLFGFGAFRGRLGL